MLDSATTARTELNSTETRRQEGIRARAVRGLQTVLRFSVGQILLQIVTALTGLCLVRWMSIADYAEFGFAFSVQSSIGLMADLGATGAITALVGNQFSNPQTLGQYMQAALVVRNRLLLLASVVGAGVFAYLTSRMGWSSTKQAEIFTILFIGLASQLWASVYGVPLILNRRLASYYGVQCGAAFIRILTIGSLAQLHRLNSISALISGALASIIIAFLFKQCSAELWIKQGKDANVIQEILKYIAPLIPGILFMSIQGQLTVLVVSYFGSVKSIAEVAALGRLAQVFTLLTAFNGIILGPRFARMEDGELRPFYLQTTLVATAVAGVSACIVLLWPRCVLWILGPKYSDLTDALRYVTVGCCVGFVSSVLWSIHSARKWIYWWSTWYFIVTMILAQALGIALLDVNTTIGASELGLLMAFAALSVHIAVAIYSFNLRRIRNQSL